MKKSKRIGEKSGGSWRLCENPKNIEQLQRIRKKKPKRTGENSIESGRIRKNPKDSERIRENLKGYTTKRETTKKSKRI